MKPKGCNAPGTFFWATVMGNRAQGVAAALLLFPLEEEDIACQHNLVRFIIMCLTLLPVTGSVAHTTQPPSCLACQFPSVRMV